MAELLARLRALLRRGTTGPDRPVLVTDHFTVDSGRSRWPELDPAAPRYLRTDRGTGYPFTP